jgi:hypothetical protein
MTTYPEAGDDISFYFSGKVVHLKRPDESESNSHTPIDTIKISLHK